MKNTLSGNGTYLFFRCVSISITAKFTDTEKTTRVEKKGEKSERKREKRGPGRIFAWAAPL